MQFFNDTPLATSLARVQLMYEDILQAIVVVKGTYAVAPSGEVRLADDQLPVLLEDTETPHGVLDTEVVPIKAGCDVALLGHARSPDPNRPVASMLVKLAIGQFERNLHVSGDRTWVKARGAYHPSRPTPFTSMPLTYERAYGGIAEIEDGVTGPHFDNPFGRGYIVQEDAVAGAPLPNIEEPDDLLTAWDQRPRVAGVAPLSRQSALRGMRGVHVDLEAQTTRIEPSMFTFAHPRMMLPAYPAGQRVRVTGAQATATPWSFVLPPFDPWLGVALGDAAYQLPVVPDTLYLLPDTRMFVVLGRRTVLYQFRPERLRSLRVLASPDPARLARPTTIRALREHPSPDLPIRPEPSPLGLMLPMDAMLAAHPMADILETLPLCPSA